MIGRFFNSLLNQTLSAQPALQLRLRAHAGKTLRLVLPIFEQIVLVDEQGSVVAGGASQADATLRLPLDALLQWPVDRIEARKRITIEGDAELALVMADVLSQTRLDPEELLSQGIGDIPARRLAKLWRSGQGAAQDRWQRLTESISDYAQYEARWLVAKPELERFVKEVDTLRDDAARLEQRIQYLEEGRH